MLVVARENNEDVFRRLIEKYKANNQYKNDQQKTHCPWLPIIQLTQELNLKDNIWWQFGRRWGKVDNIRCQCDGDILLDILNDRKADFHVKDKNRMSALHQASNHGRPDGKISDRKSSIELTPLHFVSKNKTVDSRIQGWEWTKLWKT